MQSGGVIVDTRSHEQRVAGGVSRVRSACTETCSNGGSIPARAGPTSASPPTDGPVIVMCEEGYASSLAAAPLQRLGLASATDLAGGFEAWAAAGLPVEPFTGDSASDASVPGA